MSGSQWARRLGLHTSPKLSTAIGPALAGVCVSGSALVGGTDGARSGGAESKGASRGVETILMIGKKQNNDEISRENTLHKLNLLPFF